MSQVTLTSIQSAKNTLETIPIRSYLDQTVVPLVLQALSALAQEKTKPENPIEYVADYLLKHNPEDKQAHQERVWSLRLNHSHSIHHILSTISVGMQCSGCTSGPSSWSHSADPQVWRRRSWSWLRWEVLHFSWLHWWSGSCSTGSWKQLQAPYHQTYGYSKPQTSSQPSRQQCGYRPILWSLQWTPASCWTVWSRRRECCRPGTSCLPCSNQPLILGKWLHCSARFLYGCQCTRKDRLLHHQQRTHPFVRFTGMRWFWFLPLRFPSLRRLRCQPALLLPRWARRRALLSLRDWLGCLYLRFECCWS